MSALLAEAPDTNRSAGSPFALVLGCTLELSSSPAAGLTCGEHLRSHVCLRNLAWLSLFQVAACSFGLRRAAGTSGT